MIIKESFLKKLIKEEIQIFLIEQEILKEVSEENIDKIMVIMRQAIEAVGNKDYETSRRLYKDIEKIRKDTGLSRETTIKLINRIKSGK